MDLKNIAHENFKPRNFHKSPFKNEDEKKMCNKA